MAKPLVEKKQKRKTNSSARLFGKQELIAS
jgi:hypothetical protein